MAMPSPAHVQPINLPPGVRSVIDDWVAAWQKLSPLDLMAAEIRLQATLGEDTLTDSDTYSVPSQYDFVGFQVDGFLRFTALNTEPVGTSGPLGYHYVPISERALIKAQNCLVKVQNQTRKHDLFEHEDAVLASLITPPCGMGGPRHYPANAPILWAAATEIKATFTLQETADAIVGNNTVYGVSIQGIFVPKVIRER